MQKNFKLAMSKIKSLEKHPEYTGAFIFGSVAREEQTENSDLDVKVITRGKKGCTNVNHPFVEGIKLDISFQSLAQLTQFTEEEIKSKKRVPMIAESIIIFDKTDVLKKLKQKALKAKPEKLKRKDYQWSLFMLYHADNKVQRNLIDDPATAMLAMGIGINDVLKDHYKLHGKWWVSDKRIIKDLAKWDTKLASLLRNFAISCEINNKYLLWSDILDHVSKPMGNWRKLEENNCRCSVCVSALGRLESESGV